MTPNTPAPRTDFGYRLNIFLRDAAKELLRLYYHWVYRPLHPGRRFYCRNIFDGMNALVFSNGEVTCVCSDHGVINLGNVNQASLEEVWKGPKFEEYRASFRANRLPVRHCSACFALEKVPKSRPDLYQVAPFLWNLHLETTPKCNLDCAICQRDEVEAHRGGTTLSPPTVYRLLDEIIAHRTNKIVLFFGYGEPFLDKNIYDYITYLKSRFPEVIVSISTNGIPLDNQQNVEKLLATPLDVLLFSVDGITQGEYERYRRGGNLGKALSAMERVIKRRRELNLDHPYVVWQYLYFRWNDSDASIRATLQEARRIGVDLLHFLPTRRPVTGISWKNVLKRNHGLMYKFGPLEHDYNPHGWAKVIRVTDDMTDIPIP